MSFTIVLVGRPNVGKSTLFNRLVGRREALVHDQPGVTRDRREGDGSIGDLSFRVIDTAGLEDAAAGSLTARMRAQTEAAVAEADLCLFMIDARDGVVPADESFASMARASGRPVRLVANKAESRAAEPGVMEAYSLGFGEPIPVSAEHGIGMGELHDAIRDAMEAAGAADAGAQTEDEDFDASGEGDSRKPVRIAVVGRPNAGKSTLINRLIGEDRLVTGPEAGITRDSIAIDWQWQDRPIKLFDTAGMRRKARVTDKLEELSVGDALRAIRFAEVVIVAMDATAPLEKQDLQIAALVAEEGRAMVLALTKWDLVKNRQARLAELRADLDDTLQQVRGVAMVPVSAEAGTGLNRLMQAVFEAHEVWNRRLPTAGLNRWLAAVVARHPPPAAAGRRIRLKYLSQTANRPPTFYLACSRPDALPDAYRRYLVRGLREDFELPGVPIRLMLRKDANPYGGRKR